MQGHQNGHANGHGPLSNGVRFHHAKSSSLPITFTKDEEICINNRLPKELIIRIFSFLDICNLCRCSQVCKYWYQIAFDGSNWKSINLFDFQVDVQPRVVEKIAQRCRGFLRELKLKGCRNVTDDAIRKFAENCRLIEDLDLSECKNLTDDACHHLATYCHNLSVLRLSSCLLITNNGIKELSKCHELIYLDLSWCNLRDAGLMEVAEGCPDLQRLRCTGCKEVTSQGIGAIAAGCHQLLLLSLNYCGPGVTDTALSHLSTHCPMLRVLCVSHCNISDTGLRALSQGCHDLRTLEVARCAQITDAGFSALARNCIMLERLDLEDCGLISDVTLVQLAVNCTQLNTLILSHCDQITDDGIQRLAGGLCGSEHLRYLAMDNCPMLTDSAVEQLGSHCKKLSRVDIFDCQLITRNGIRKLETSNPNLQVHAYFAPVTPPGSTREPRRRYCRCCTLL